MALAIKKLPQARPQGVSDSRKIVAEEISNELVFAIVGHVGSGNTTVAAALQDVLKQQRVKASPFKVAIIKARTVIDEGLAKLGTSMPIATGKLLSEVQGYQNAGDKLREQDHAAVARGAVSLIRKERATMQGTVLEPDKPVLPDGNPRAFIVDSIRHPAEVGLLRRIYGDAFVLIGVVCEQDERRRRISKKYSDAGESAAEAFMKRDAKASEKHGQRVSDAFHLSDFFVDNTAQRILDDNRTPNPDWKVTEDLERLIQLVTHAVVARPGFCDAINLSSTQLVGVRITRSNDYKLYSSGERAVRRGTALQISPRVGLLWTTGFIEKLGTYPGRETPNPLRVEIVNDTRNDTKIDTVLNDIMMLTKMNFNSCVYADGIPVTMRFADAIGDVLITAKDERVPPLPFRYYI